MNIYSDEGNFRCLKVLTASNLKTLTLTINFVDGGRPSQQVSRNLLHNKLPVVEVSPGQFLSSPNAACKYIMADELLEVDSWLEWESALLQPVLVPVLISSLSGGKIDSHFVTTLRQLLTELNQALDDQEYLVQNQLSSADVVIWSSLYPVFSDNTSRLYKDLDNGYSNVLHWFSRCKHQDAFKRAVTSVTSNKGISVFKNSLLSQPAPLSATSKRASGHVSESTKSTEVSGSETVVTAEELSAAVEGWTNGQSRLAPPIDRVHPILPKEGAKNVLITSALPYVNNVPHLGNIIGCVLSADVFSRYCRLRNYNVLYVSGTDEYGTATETKAVEEGLTPRQICDKYNALHAEIYDWFNIDFDYFGRTSTHQQTKIAQDIFWHLYKNGKILKDQVEQLLCEKCNRFLADRFVEGTCPFCNYGDARGDQCDKCGKLINAPELRNPKCKVCGSTPVVKSSNHLFLDLPSIEGDLVNFLDTTCDEGLWTANAKLITKSWVRDGLKPRCITRDLKWGTPVPLEGYTDKVFYVWFDAPIGYLSITANYTPEWERWWKNPQQVELYNFMAKDNVPFHSVVFPCSLLGTGENYTLVNHLVATEYLNYEDGKFSKSRGVGVFGNNAKDTAIPADIWRFYLLFVRPETQDSVFSWDDFVLKNNSELLNNLGNFINRALTFLEKNFGGIVPEMTLGSEEKELIALVNREVSTYIANLEHSKLREGIRNILSISRLGNQYMQSTKPWVLVKGDVDQRHHAGAIIGLSANISCLLSVLLQPYMPAVSQTIQSQLKAPSTCNVLSEQFICHLTPGHKIGQPSPLFQKIEQSLADEMKKRYAGTQSERSEAEKVKKANPAPVSTPSVGPIDPEKVAKLTTEVARQGDVVRQLKTEKADKSKIDQEVALLLDLKKQLCIAEGKPAETKKKGKKK